VHTGDVIAFVHASTDIAARDSAHVVMAAMPIGDERVRRRALVKQRLA
jgi:hypothetical protein